MDLTKEYPRSVREELHGVVQLPRTIDKAKASAARKLGDYTYNCPMDEALFALLGIDHAAFLEVVRNASNDREIETYAKQFTDKKSVEEIQTWNHYWLSRAPEPGTEMETYFLGLRDQMAPERTDVRTWVDLLDLDEKRDVPQRAPA